MSSGPTARSRQRRRRWRRAAPEARAAAAASLANLGRRRRQWGALWLLAGLLAFSAAVHVALLPFTGFGKGTDLAALAEKDSYLQKVMAKDRARRVAREVAGRQSMPPPPPDPQSVVEHALSSSLTGDVGKITAGLMDVKLQDELKDFVRSSLADELAAAAKDIAEGKLTDAQIQELHRRFQEKAQEKTVEWRQDYLERTQVQRAAVSTTEWYENEVAKTLFRNISFELFRPPGYSEHPPSPEMWHVVFTGQYGWGPWPKWGHIESHKFIEEKINRLGSLLAGSYPYAAPGQRNVAWPGPSLEQARIIDERLRELFEGSFTETYPEASWQMCVYGAKREPRMTFGVLAEFFPQRYDQMKAKFDATTEVWKQALEASRAYRLKAEEGAEGVELAPAQKACFAAIEAVRRAVSPLLLPRERANRIEQVYFAAGLDVIRRNWPRMYDFWVNGLVEDLSPLIRDLAKGQFKKGIIAHKDGVDEAMREFPEKIVPLLKRDVEAMLSRKRFFEAVNEPFMNGRFRSIATGNPRVPTDAEVDAELKAAADAEARWPAADRGYMDACRPALVQHFENAVYDIKEEILQRVLTGNLLFRQMNVYVEGVDYSDEVQERLSARQMALEGRGQDLARLTADGVPDTSAPMVALMFGASKGHGANLQPVATRMQPAFFADGLPPEAALANGALRMPPPPADWDVTEQAKVAPAFTNTPRFEAIPFLARFPRLDGRLDDWGEIRPLTLRGPRGSQILVYAAWNYQGLFFGYRVSQRPEQYYYAKLWETRFHGKAGTMQTVRVGGVAWAFKGDYLRLMFDTLDARNDNRGEPHTQEFVIFPRGLETEAALPGIERVIASQRDAQRKEYRGVKDSAKIFPQQPSDQQGPDGSGPFRVTRVDDKGYTCEVFLPRSLFEVPVFCPGWYLGFDCVVATGAQKMQRNREELSGQYWAANEPDRPNLWGDLLLLGTDPYIELRNADTAYTPTRGIIPGGSYLLTIVDPDRNVYPNAKDSVIVSAEVIGGANDVEVFVLTETKENSGVFRGFINTQPGRGRQVQGVLEVMPLQQIRFGYVDVANARGQRNVVSELTLPVISPVSRVMQTAAR